MNRTRISGLVAALAIVAAACAPAAGAPTWTYTPGSQAGAPSPAPTQGGTGGEVLGSLEIVAVDLGFEPKGLSVDKPGRYAVTLTNDGAIPHDITFADGTMGVANAGEAVTVEVDVPESGLTFICSIPGHADAGMQGAITVAGSTAGGENPDDHGGPAPATDVQAPGTVAQVVYAGSLTRYLVDLDAGTRVVVAVQNQEADVVDPERMRGIPVVVGFDRQSCFAVTEDGTQEMQPTEESA